MKKPYAPVSFFEFQKRFSTEEACWRHLLKVRWPEGFVCPRCGHREASFHRTRRLFQCKACRYQASVTAGTVFHKTRTPLVKWFWMIYLMSSQKTGVSILGLQRLLEIPSYQTAWAMAHKIRRAMGSRDAAYRLAGLIEMDDTYVGPPGGKGRGTTKTPVVVAVESRGKKAGFASMRVVEDLSKERITAFSNEKIGSAHAVRTDGFASYFFGLGDHAHEMVIVENGDDASKLLPWVHTLIANAKNMLRGAHHGVSTKHLQRYLDEFCYRFNRRFWPAQSFSRLLQATITTTPTTYAELIA